MIDFKEVYFNSIRQLPDNLKHRIVNNLLSDLHGQKGLMILEEFEREFKEQFALHNERIYQIWQQQKAAFLVNHNLLTKTGLHVWWNDKTGVFDAPFQTNEDAEDDTVVSISTDEISALYEKLATCKDDIEEMKKVLLQYPAVEDF